MKLKKNLANLFTLTNLTMGLISLILSASMNPLPLPGRAERIPLSPYLLSALLILMAACMDRFDGKIARKTDAVSDLGKQLDSLCDLVSFGVAPAILTWKIHVSTISYTHTLLWLCMYIAILLYPLCGAMRLAKFNLQEDASYFIGIPITLAGAFVAFSNCVYLLYFHNHKYNSYASSFILFLILLLAVLMVAPFQIRKR